MSQSQCWTSPLLLPIKTICNNRIGNHFQTFTFNFHVLVKYFKKASNTWMRCSAPLSSLLFCSTDSSTNVFFSLQNYKSRLFSTFFLFEKWVNEMKLTTGWDKKSAARVGEGQTLLNRTAKRKYFYHNEAGEGWGRSRNSSQRSGGYKIIFSQ